MAVNENLFLYDLAIVAIFKNEGRYIKEWLDYHLLAGVDHFYLYDNDSTDNYKEIIAPYVKAGLVTVKYFPGESMQFAAYDDAVLNYRFHCRYMAFVDLDEFIFPKNTTGAISATLDGILKHFPDAAGLAVNWQIFGSNGQETADYSRGVLERFTKRAPVDWVVPIPNRDIPGGNAQVKTIVNPRRVYFFTSGHFPLYYEGCHAVNEIGGVVPNYCNEPVTAEKIAINHYNVKSREEHKQKISKGRAGKKSTYLDSTWFDMYDRNEEFDDGILRYRAARAERFSLEGDGEKFNRVLETLTKILSAYVSETTPREFFIGKMETALTCRAVSTYLRERFPHNQRLRIYEEASLAAILKSLDGIKLSDTRLLISEFPNLLSLPYPVVKDLRDVTIQIISHTMDFMRQNEFWKDFSDLEHLRRLLKNI